MKYKIFIAFLLIVQISLFGQSPNYSKIQLPNDIFSRRYISINGDFWGQVPAFEKKVEGSDSILFKTEGGLLQIIINGIIIRDKQNQVIICLFVDEIKGQGPGISATVNNTQVQYELEGKGFGFYGGKYIYNNEYKIITRLKLIAAGYPDYYLEFPVIVQITAVGNIDNLNSFIPDYADYFHLHPAAGK